MMAAEEKTIPEETEKAVKTKQNPIGKVNVSILLLGVIWAISQTKYTNTQVKKVCTP